MPGWNGAWRRICRSIARRPAIITINPRSRRNDSVRRYDRTLALVRRIGRGLRAIFRSTGRHVQQVQASRALPWVEAMRKERRANRRALVLLLKLLNPLQRQEFRNTGFIHAVGGNSGTRYRIRPDTIANIDVLCDDGRVKYRLCITPTGGVPMYDVMAAQMLHLQDPATEPKLLRMANIHPARREDLGLSVFEWIP